MSFDEKDAKKISNSKLALYVVSCHVDTPLSNPWPQSKYEIQIQAGAALTDKRICEINDHDGFVDSISDRNSRYSECTALFWASKHISSDYVGFEHYRRRFTMPEEKIEAYLDEGFDIITSDVHVLNKSIEADYRETHFSKDWDLFLELIHEFSPEYYDFALEEFNKNEIHACNINIFSRKLFKEYSDWCFPILDAFYVRSARKKDTYQGRDVGFICERLSHLFVMKKKSEGYKVFDEKVIDLRTKVWIPQDSCNTSDKKDVLRACEELFAKRQFIKCKNIIGAAIGSVLADDEDIKNLADVFVAAELERLELPMTMYEYLPESFSNDIISFCNAYLTLSKMVDLVGKSTNAETVKLFEDYLKATHFSYVVVRRLCDELGLDKDVSNLLVAKALKSNPSKLRRRAIFVKGKIETLDYFCDQMISEANKLRMDYHVIDVNVPDTYGKKLAEFIAGREDECFVITLNHVAVNLLNGGKNSWDMLGIPVFDWCQDHPWNFSDTLDNPCEMLREIVLDKNHEAFIRKYYPKVKDIYFSPNGGNTVGEIKPFSEREIDICYVGDCQPIPYLVPIEEFEDGGKEFYQTCLEVLKENSGMTVESIIELYLDQVSENLSMDWKKEFIIKYAPVVHCYIRRIFKLQIMRTLEKTGARIEVYGNGWETGGETWQSNVNIHGRISSEECNVKLGQSKIGINIMPWFKDGCSERVFNVMLNGAVCVTDTSEYLLDEFEHGKELVFYDMQDMDSLYNDVMWLLNNPDGAAQIAETGYMAAWKHSWKERFRKIVSWA